MELLYYIDMTEEYYANVSDLGPRFDINLHEYFLFKLGKITGELGIGPVDLKIYKEASSMDKLKIFVSFTNPEDAMAFKLKWT